MLGEGPLPAAWTCDEGLVDAPRAIGRSLQELPTGDGQHGADSEQVVDEDLRRADPFCGGVTTSTQEYDETVLLDLGVPGPAAR